MGEVSSFNTSKALLGAVLLQAPGSEVELNRLVPLVRFACYGAIAFGSAQRAIAPLQALRQSLLIRFAIAAKILPIGTNLVSPNIEGNRYSVFVGLSPHQPLVSELENYRSLVAGDAI